MNDKPNNDFPNTKRHLVFVYGTLRSGQPANWMMQDHGEFIASGFTSGRMIDLGRFPAVTLGDGGTIRGEVWWVTDRGLAMLDRYEEVGRLYRRVAATIESDAPLPPSDTFEAWVYEIIDPPADAPAVASGDWVAALEGGE